MTHSKASVVRLLVAWAIVSPLAGCAFPSLRTTMQQDITAYQAAGGATADQQLVLNILRSENDEPLHFIDVSTLHGSSTASAQFGESLPFPTPGKGSLSPLLTFGQAPSFDLGTFDTQDFWTGIASRPIDPAVIGSLLDNGFIDQRIAYLLFFSEIDDVPFDGPCNNHSVRRINDNRSDPTAAHSCRAERKDKSERPEDWWPYLGMIGYQSRSGQLFVHPFFQLTPVGPPTPSPALKDLSSLDSTKFRLQQQGGKYQLYSVSDQRYAFCRRQAEGRPPTLVGLANVSAAARVDDSICRKDELRLDKSALTLQPGERGAPVVHVRSVYGIVRYLGQVLAAEDPQSAHNHCITLDNSGDCAKNVLFKLSKKTPLHNETSSLVTVDYRGETYGMPVETTGCLRQPAWEDQDSPCDHSAEVLSILNLLLNFNKTAKSLQTTPVVRAVP